MESLLSGGGPGGLIGVYRPKILSPWPGNSGGWQFGYEVLFNTANGDIHFKLRDANGRTRKEISLASVLTLTLGYSESFDVSELFPGSLSTQVKCTVVQAPSLYELQSE